MKSFAGIGSRETPLDAERDIHQLCRDLAPYRSLRSGGATGADEFFYSGYVRAGGVSEIFLPFKNYASIDTPYESPQSEAFEVAKEYHPAWHILSLGARRMMARNAHIILGWSLNDPVDFVVCWTWDGAETASETSKMTGGTGMGIRLADDYGIRVYNVYNVFSREELAERVQEIQNERVE